MRAALDGLNRPLCDRALDPRRTPRAPELRVRGIGIGDQLGVVPARDDPAVFEHDDAVGALRDVEPVDDRDDGAVAERSMKVALGARGGDRVELRGGFVEHDHRRIEAHETRERELLGAGRGHLVVAEADLGVEAVRKCVRPRERVDRVECRAHVVIARIRSPEPDVLGDAPTEHVAFLRDHGDHASPRVRLELVDRHAAHFHVAAAGVQEPGDDLAERGLARAARADDRQTFARRDVQADAVEHERAGVVAEHHVVDVARRPRWSSAAGAPTPSLRVGRPEAA